jgi:hypothetical protein
MAVQHTGRTAHNTVVQTRTTLRLTDTYSQVIWLTTNRLRSRERRFESYWGRYWGRHWGRHYWGRQPCDQEIPAMTSKNVFWLRSAPPPGADTACHRPPVPAPQVHPSRSLRSPALDEPHRLPFLSAG